MDQPDEISGRHLCLIIEREKERTGEFMSNSSTSVLTLTPRAGIIYTVDVTKPKGEKITILKMADGKPFDRVIKRIK